MVRDPFLTLLVSAVLMTTVSGSSRADSQGEIDPFGRTHLGIELTRNYPVSFGQNRFIPGHAHPLFGYRYNLGGHWLMGLSAHFKIFDRRDPTEEQQDQVAVWTLAHESLYVIRLYHPTYLLVGPKLLYLLPTKGAVFPLQRDTDFETEIGGALTMTLARLLSDRWMATLRVDRWRGTRTMRFHGLETAIGIWYALP